MKIMVSRSYGVGYSFVVEKEKDYDTTDSVIAACLQLERELVTKEIEEDEMEDE